MRRKASRVRSPGGQVKRSSDEEWTEAASSTAALMMCARSWSQEQGRSVLTSRSGDQERMHRKGGLGLLSVFCHPFLCFNFSSEGKTRGN